MDFRHDVMVAERQLGKEIRRDFWLRLLTLRLANNRRCIAAAHAELKRSRADLIQYESQLLQVRHLDDLLLETIELSGVRISKHTFADVPVLDPAGYGTDWEQIRETVLSRDNHECQESDGYCKGPLQIHHIVPLSKGGTNDVDNLLTLCFYHHCDKHPHMKARYDGNLWC